MRLLDDAKAFGLTIAITDRVLRVPASARSADLFADAVDHFGTGSSFGPLDRIALMAGSRLARPLHRIVMPLVKRRVRRESTGVIFPADAGRLSRHLGGRRASGMRANINVLGEAILGEAEAARRSEAVRAMIHCPDVDYMSVKISAVASQLESFAFDASVARVVERLAPLFRAASACSPQVFVNLDMEEFRDLDMTVAAFTTLLDRSELDHYEAGIVLQAYLPDSHAAFEHLSRWASERHARTGTGIKVRIVKGANLAMEKVEAELHGWHQAPYDTKVEVDASWKRLVDTALTPERTAAVRVGIASHNLFDLAFAMLLASDREVTDRIDIEMLEGMAMAEAREIQRRLGRVLLYTPVTGDDDFVAAVAYLVRRLDENAAPENYLRVAGTIRPGSSEFTDQADRFRLACQMRFALNTDSHRTSSFKPLAVCEEFTNAPDTDLAVASNRDVINEAVSRWQRVTLPDLALADLESVERLVATARAAAPGWAARTYAERRVVLETAAALMHEQRAEAIGCMVREAGKTVAEADPEVSEAIDFANYYGRSAEQLAAEVTHVVGAPLGVVVVAPPWNFPYAITAGGVCAALATGNTVIVKPAPEVVHTGRLLVEQLWQAGVPCDVLQFVRCPDNEVGQRLITHEHVDAVVLTGAYATAEMFLGWKPSMHLIAETSGKNAMVITAAADLDAAVKDLVKSAFGHAGQKCSAASLAIVEAGMYDDPAFLRQLDDAVRSLHVGPAHDPSTSVGPVIASPTGSLRRALSWLDEGERWLIEPEQLGDVWSPGVKLGVQPGSWSHRNEWFGPVLGVMRVPDLETAIAWQNGTDYGLTGGIHSLDEDEIRTWLDRVEVGNAYINRPTTGAIVQRQPFGGWKQSSIGPGAKAGGPNYVAAFQRWSAVPGVRGDSFAQWHDAHFRVSHDPSALRAEWNVFRYRPLETPSIIRIGSVDEGITAAIALKAARTMGAAVDVSSAVAYELANVVESDSELLARLPRRTRVRLCRPATDDFRRAAGDRAIVVDDAPVVADGRIELLRWCREQSVSVTNHRYGNIGTAPLPFDCGELPG
jgi:RHH-type transcriptional regulator, proline utilization regulon repressor / proline dehydrogenase / delta 1-pyrroline-5-carboxylate dehydrogenase